MIKQKKKKVIPMTLEMAKRWLDQLMDLKKRK